MCYKHGSIEEETSVCPMCRVFKHARCPHVKDVCRDRANHPAHDVVFLKNPEVSTFNGCGYCKWARSSGQAKAPNTPNSGWPGCCRAPSTGEALRIPPADWIAVTAVHKVPPPPEIRALLDSLAPPPMPLVARGQVSPKLGSNASLTPQKAASGKGVGPQVVIPKTRRNGSPKIASVSPARNGTALPPSSPVLAPGEMRRSGSGRRDSSPAARVGSMRRSLEQESTIGRRATVSSGSKKPPTASSLSLALAQTSLADEARPMMKRRGSGATEASHNSGGSGNSDKSASVSGSSPPRLLDVKNTPSRTPRKISSLENVKSPKLSSPENAKAPKTSNAEVSKPSKASAPRAKQISSAASDGSSTGSSAFSESTVTSEGFTDYLSDESEAEMQRQAEEKAARLPVTWEEDEEFARARKQLTGVGLRPPAQWGPGRAATVASRSSTGRSSGYPTASTLQQRLKA